MTMPSDIGVYMHSSLNSRLSVGGWGRGRSPLMQRSVLQQLKQVGSGERRAGSGGINPPRLFSLERHEETYLAGTSPSLGSIFLGLYPIVSCFLHLFSSSQSICCGHKESTYRLIRYEVLQTRGPILGSLP